MKIEQIKLLHVTCFQRFTIYVADGARIPHISFITRLKVRQGGSRKSSG